MEGIMDKGVQLFHSPLMTSRKQIKLQLTSKSRLILKLYYVINYGRVRVARDFRADNGGRFKLEINKQGTIQFAIIYVGNITTGI